MIAKYLSTEIGTGTNIATAGWKGVVTFLWEFSVLSCDILGLVG